MHRSRPGSALCRPCWYRYDGRSRLQLIGPGDDLEMAVVMLDQRRAALHPVAAVHVADACLVADHGVVDVAADHTVGVMAPCLGRERLLERADIVDGVLDLLLRPLRQRPI